MSKDKGLAGRDTGGRDRGLAFACTVTAFAGPAALDSDLSPVALGGGLGGAVTAGGAVFARFGGGPDGFAFESVVKCHAVGALGPALLVVEL